MRIINITVLLFCVASFHQAHAQFNLFERFFGPPTTTITCSPAHSRPENGFVSCTNSNKLNSVCTFRCNNNFRLVGSGKSVCRNGVWTSTPPSCTKIIIIRPPPRAITCSPAQSNPTNGAVTCTKSNKLNSVCTFRCNGNFRLVGSTQSVCRHGGWSNLPAPVCRRKAIKKPVCLYRDWSKCNPVSGGTSYREKLLLPGQPQSCPKRVTKDCEDGEMMAELFLSNFEQPVGAIGQPTLLGRHLMISGASTNFQPQPSTSGNCTNKNALYSNTGALIAGSCHDDDEVDQSRRRKRQVPIQTKRDLLFMMDESGSVGRTRFVKVKRIVAAIVELLCGAIRYHQDYTRIGVRTFDRIVHPKVNFNFYTTAKTLANKVKAIRYTESTSDRTCMADALDDALNILTSADGVRKYQHDVEQDIIMVTDGCANCKNSLDVLDSIKEKSKNFKNAGIHVYVIGIGLRQNCKESLRILARGGRCFHFFYLDRWDYDVDSFLKQLEDPPNGSCLNVFEHPLGQCLPSTITCSPAHSNPANGAVTCTKSNKLNSVCTFSCNGNFRLVGSKVSRCQNGGWSSTPPVCRRKAITCSPAHSNPANGAVTCTKSNKLNSVCTFSCNGNFRLVGSKVSRCQNGGWSSTPPVCRRKGITCSPARSNPTNGAVTCSKSNNLNSVCTFRCNCNFRLNGWKMSVCQNGGWSRSAPTCRRKAITCSPAHSNPTNGYVTCTNSNNLNSECTFRCNCNYALIGSKVSRCQNGVWSSTPPVCRRKAITCLPAHSHPRNGLVSCTNSNILDSVCTFRCHGNFELVGSKESVCRLDGWTNLPPPICRRKAITCLPAHSHPRNGLVSCTNSNSLNSVCTFRCHGNFRLVGSTQSVCRLDGWTNLPPPICRRKAITCSPVHSNPTNGLVSCTKSNSINSVCTFRCHGNFRLVGSTQSVCRLDGWTNLPPPICRRKVLCEYDDGDSCTSQDGTNFYKIRKAKGCPDNRVKCTKPEVGAALFQSNLLGPQAFQHGSSSSGGGGAQAPASFGKGVSFAGRTLFLPTTAAPKPQKPSCSGIPDGNGGFAFGSCNARIPLTRKNTLVSNKKRDLVLLLDESGSVGKKKFENVKRIAAAIVKLLCGDIRYHKIYTRITVISFDQQVHFHIPLNKYLPSAADLAEFIRKKIIYDYTTHGSTCLGKALEFVNDVALTVGGRRGNPDTEQDVIIITNGCSNCGYKGLNADQTIDYFVKKFKGAGIHVYVIGIGLTGHQANCKDKLSVLATGGRCYHFFYLDRWDYDVELFIQQLEKPPNGACVNVFEHPSGQCLPSGR